MNLLHGIRQVHLKDSLEKAKCLNLSILFREGANVTKAESHHPLSLSRPGGPETQEIWWASGAQTPHSFGGVHTRNKVVKRRSDSKH